MLVNDGSLQYFSNPVKFSEFLKAKPFIIISDKKVSMKKMKDLYDAFTIVIKRDDIQEWENFTEMARLISTYASALVACEGRNRNKCDAVDALLLFI
ncbi:hypothetical protein V6M85_03300 [Sulfolobus tengchongensis]|uniref:Uncharacterized protein n=1 Tax=Sulfolobus tengchongensis TaxID=207809 RepID=A0AAX4L4J3_9CREN